MKKAYQLTAAGKADLEKELKELKSQRSSIAQKIADARDFGDLSENAEWAEARNEQGHVESRIAEIEEILQSSSIIKPKASDKVVVGNTVELKSSNGKKVRYAIVGSVEADPLAGKISNESPIGRALMGKKVGDSVSIKTPSGEASYGVVAIS